MLWFEMLDARGLLTARLANGRVDDIARTALWITFSVIAFTIHSQDLKVSLFRVVLTPCY